LKVHSQCAEAVVSAIASFDHGLRRLKHLDGNMTTHLGQQHDTGMHGRLDAAKQRNLVAEDSWMSFRYPVRR
jgi:hypothetical protein